MSSLPPLLSSAITFLLSSIVSDFLHPSPLLSHPSLLCSCTALQSFLLSPLLDLPALRLPLALALLHLAAGLFLLVSFLRLPQRCTPPNKHTTRRARTHPLIQAAC
mmetsp:Transcript_4143/g.12681  ORF Transcript_4143/g.12681 Transcript_4143/m.12681 type:complete len:106 (-) Transcript_4143:324-641(-)